MTIEDIEPIITYAENGVTVDFAVPFEFILPEFLAVTRTDPAGLRTLLTLGADYSVFGGEFDFGSITTAAPAAGGWELEIARVTPQEQPMDYTPNDTFPAESHEDALDREMMCIQELDRNLALLESRALRVPIGETINVLPPAAARGGKYLWFYPDGSAGVAEGTSGGGGGGTGGNVMSIGLFIAAPTLVVLAGADLVQTSGYAAVGQGAALYQADVAVDAAFVAANPRTAFVTANGRGFRLYPQQRLTIEMFGGRADCPVADWNYYSGLFASSNPMPGVYTDNLPAITAAMAFGPAWMNSHNKFTPTIYFEGSAGQFGYGFSGTIVPKKIIHLKGRGNGTDVVSSTVFRFPPNTTGLEFRRNNQNNSIDEETAGSMLEGIYFYGGGGTDRTKHGLWQRVNMTVRDCVFDSFPGNNINCTGHASASSSDPIYGFTSGSYYERVLCRMAGNHNCYVVGSDASASYCVGLRCRISRLCGIYDGSYFGCQWFGFEIDDYSDGRVGQCHRGGRHYVLIDPTAGIGAATTPGTAATNHIWYDQEAGGVSATWPEWSAANTYEVSCPIWSANGTFVGGYVEIFIVCHLSGGRAYGCLGMATMFSRWDGGASTQSRAFYNPCGYGNYTVMNPPHPMLGDSFEASIGPNMGQGNEGIVWKHRAQADGDVDWSYRYNTTQRDLSYRFGNSGRHTYEITGPNTVEQAGSGVPQPRYIKFTGFMLASINGVNPRRHHTDNVAPTTGTWARGDIIWNRDPSAAGKVGWVCTVTGSPGTWKAFGAIDP